MPWDKDLPNNGTKIRSYPTVITDNWNSIELGDVDLRIWNANFAERNTIPAAPPVDPTRIDDTMVLYSKNDGTNTEMFLMDDISPAPNIIQISQGNALGSTATQVNTNGLVYDTTPATTLTFGKNNMITAYGNVASGGAGSSLFNCTTAQLAGVYTVSFSKNMASTNYKVIATATHTGIGGGNRSAVCCWQNKALDKFEVVIRYTDDSSTLHTIAWDFIVIGGL